MERAEKSLSVLLRTGLFKLEALIAVLTLEVPLLHHLLGKLLASSDGTGLYTTSLELLSTTAIVAAANKVEDSLTLSVLGTDVMARVGRDGGSSDGSEKERGQMHLDSSDQTGKI